MTTLSRSSGDGKAKYVLFSGRKHAPIRHGQWKKLPTWVKRFAVRPQPVADAGQGLAVEGLGIVLEGQQFGRGTVFGEPAAGLAIAHQH